MDIVFSINNKYVEHLVVVLCSICENTQDSCNFYIINKDISVKNIEIIQNFIKCYKNKNIQFIRINDNFIEKCPINQKQQNKDITVETYFRLFLTDLLPKTLNKVIYLDCDIIVRINLQELWNIDVSDYAIAGVLDTLTSDYKTYNRLKYLPKYGYINAGILLINLEFWRKNKVIENFKDIILTIPDMLQFHDQDVLNLSFYDKKLILPFKFNYHEGLVRKELSILYTYWDEIYKTEMNPSIIHYSGSIKPWHKNCPNPYLQEFFKYKKKTPFCNSCLQKLKQPIKLKIKFFLKVCFAFTKLCNPPLDRKTLYRKVSISKD